MALGVYQAVTTLRALFSYLMALETKSEKYQRKMAAAIQYRKASEYQPGAAASKGEIGRSGEMAHRRNGIIAVSMQWRINEISKMANNLAINEINGM